MRACALPSRPTGRAALTDPLTSDADIGAAAFVLALRGRSVRDTAVLRAMEGVPRERFAPARHRELARRDIALPLPHGASMTAPGEVAAMLALLKVEPGQRVLEVGTGSGYVTALLAALGAGAVTSLERYPGLVASARAALGDGPAQVLHADGLAEAGPGPYERVLVNAAVAAPLPLWIGALAPGGRLVVGLAGPGRAAAFERTAAGLVEEAGAPVRLAPLVPGRAGS